MLLSFHPHHAKDDRGRDIRVDFIYTEPSDIAEIDEGTGVGDEEYWYRVVKPYPDYQGVKSFNVRVEGDCLYARTRTLEEKYFDARGKVLGQQAIDGLPRNVSPGTLGEDLLLRACSL